MLKIALKYKINRKIGFEERNLGHIGSLLSNLVDLYVTVSSENPGQTHKQLTFIIIEDR